MREADRGARERERGGERGTRESERRRNERDIGERERQECYIPLSLRFISTTINKSLIPGFHNHHHAHPNPLTWC